MGRVRLELPSGRARRFTGALVWRRWLWALDLDHILSYRLHPMAERAEASQVSTFPLGQRTYNTISYLGAVVVMVAFGNISSEPSAWVAGLWVFHFLRRSLESLFVHRFSGRSIPPSDYLLEYLYYWGFGFWIAKSLAADDYQAASAFRLWGGLALFALGQTGNTWAHLKLRSLRPKSGVADKRIPKGGLFSLVACPHYLFEIVIWAGFALLANVWGAVAFFVVATAILASYARERHLAYQDEFDGKEGRPRYPASRRALVPFIY